MKEIPEAPGGLPFLGHTAAVLRDPCAYLASLAGRDGLVRIRLGALTAVLPCDPELTGEVLRDDRTFDKGGTLVERVKETAGEGLFSSPRDLHRRQRRLTQPAFHHGRLPGYAEAMTGQIAAVTSGWHDGRILDAAAETKLFAMRTATQTLLSSTLSPQAAHRAGDDLTAILTGTLRRAIMPDLLNRLPTPGNRAYRRAGARLRATLHDVVLEYRAGGGDRGDLASALLAAQDADGSGGGDRLSDTEVIDQLVTFFIGGTEAAATTLAWALHLLSRHPDVQRRLHAEADAVLAGAPAAWEHLPALKTTGLVVTETLRMYPPAWLLTRSATTDTVLGGHPLPAGTTVAYSPYLIHHRGDVYEDPDRFDPDRWDASSRPQPPRDAFIPFGAGGRKCIGEQFGFTETVLALASISARWRLTPAPGARVRAVAGFTLCPDGLKLKASKRSPTPP